MNGGSTTAGIMKADAIAHEYCNDSIVLFFGGFAVAKVPLTPTHPCSLPRDEHNIIDTNTMHSIRRQWSDGSCTSGWR